MLHLDLIGPKIQKDNTELKRKFQRNIKLYLIDSNRNMQVKIRELENN